MNAFAQIAQVLTQGTTVDFDNLPGTTTLIHDSDNEKGRVVFCIEDGEVFDIR